MSMSTWVVGFIPPDEEWQKKVAAWHACKLAGVSPPQALEEALGLDPGCEQEPDPQGREVDIDKSGAVAEYKADMREGYEVDVSKLPPGVRVVRFVNSW